MPGMLDCCIANWFTGWQRLQQSQRRTNTWSFEDAKKIEFEIITTEISSSNFNLKKHSIV